MYLGERGLTLVEVLASIVVLGVIGIASTNLVLRVISMREAALRTEQQSVAARAAAEHIWDLFARDDKERPADCLPFSDDRPSPDEYKVLDDNFDFAFWCQEYEDSAELFQVRVWLSPRDPENPDVPEPFDMLALIGGYAADEDASSGE